MNKYLAHNLYDFKKKHFQIKKLDSLINIVQKSFQNVEMFGSMFMNIL